MYSSMRHFFLSLTKRISFVAKTLYHIYPNICNSKSPDKQFIFYYWYHFTVLTLVTLQMFITTNNAVEVGKGAHASKFIIIISIQTDRVPIVSMSGYVRQQ